MTCPIDFNTDGQDGAARAGTLRLARGEIRTPVYMPVGTRAAVRTLSPDQLKATNSQIVLANTYHLHQRPGEDVVAKHGGLHGFMNVDLPVLTDSGGFQVFSLDKKKITEEGVTFRYEIDGKETFLSPENAMDIQQKLGADIAMVFDECLPFGADETYARESVKRTTRWEKRCLAAHHRPDQHLFGIVQGGFWPELRRQSVEEICSLPFDGFAIGGLSVGEGYKIMCEVLDYTAPIMPKHLPRYLMGVGRPLDLVEAVARGVDMFDCVLQTRHARGGVFYTSRGRIRISDSRYRTDMYAPDTSCACYACTNFTRAYIHHLFRVGEVLGATLATIHNLTWFAAFMAEMRTSILEKRFETFRAGVHETYPEKPKQKQKQKSQRGRKSRKRTKRTR